MEYNNFDEELNALHNRVLAKALTVNTDRLEHTTR